MSSKYTYCVNALNGLSSFLQSINEKKKELNKGVNALNGLSSFLLTPLHQATLNKDMCQRPKRAFFISTTN